MTSTRSDTAKEQAAAVHALRVETRAAIDEAVAIALATLDALGELQHVIRRSGSPAIQAAARTAVIGLQRRIETITAPGPRTRH
jgi:hypothetical protein